MIRLLLVLLVLLVFGIIIWANSTLKDHYRKDDKEY